MGSCRTLWSDLRFQARRATTKYPTIASEVDAHGDSSMFPPRAGRQEGQSEIESETTTARLMAHLEVCQRALDSLGFVPVLHGR